MCVHTVCTYVCVHIHACVYVFLLTKQPVLSQTTQRKAVVRSFFHPLERSKLETGNVARMVRDIEASSVTLAQQREAAGEPGSVLSSSKLPMQPKVPTAKADDKMERFFSSLLEKVCTNMGSCTCVCSP